MNSNSPPEVPQSTQGSSLSPESPLPLHVPEPQNIAVLQNQFLPDFDLVSTHIGKSSSLLVPISGSHVDSEILPATEAGKFQGDPSNEKTATGLNLENSQSVTAEQISDMIKETRDDNKLQNHLSPSPQPSVSLDAPPSLFLHDQSTLASHAPSPSHDEAPDNPAQHSNVEPHPDNAIMNRGASPLPANTLGEPVNHNNGAETDVKDEASKPQRLFDKTAPHTVDAPATESIVTVSPDAFQDVSKMPSPSLAQTPIATFPPPAGLPPRPPPQEKPAIHPNYAPDDDIRSYHNPPQQSSAPPSYNAQINTAYRPPQTYTHSTGVAPNGLPPPPLATFQQSALPANQIHNVAAQTPIDHQHEDLDKLITSAGPTPAAGLDGTSNGKNTEQLYNEFLREEAVYVSEGTWDRFPRESRLFVGNLYTEKVTKRDLFNVFSRYGRLAQISMKSAYGFVQYVDPGCSYRALQAEEGAEIRGRKIHLEISKPQKNTRNATATASGDAQRAAHGRRSRSPDYARGNPMRRGARSDADRYDRMSTSHISERRGRDDYRPTRSPSPRGFRGRDEFRGRDRSSDRYFTGRQTRSRSPYGRAVRYRSRSPRSGDPDDEANLPMARRMPGNIPDVQLILVDEVDRTFVGYIAQSFRDRGLRCEVLQLPRVSLVAVVRRQVIEGVQAVVKILRTSQVTGKIPLQVFNRSSGAENVKFEEYENLDANVAAEIAVRAKNTHMAPSASTQYPQAQMYGGSQYGQNTQQMSGQHMAAQQALAGQPSNIANLITSLDGPALQKLLGQMGTTGQSPQTSQSPYQQLSAQQPGHSQDLAALLGNVSRHQQQSPRPQTYPYQETNSTQYVQSGQLSQQAYQQQSTNSQASQHQFAMPNGQTPQQEYPLQSGPVPNNPYANSPAVSQFLNRENQGPQNGPIQYPQHQQPGQQQNVQDIMAHLARYRQ